MKNFAFVLLTLFFLSSHAQPNTSENKSRSFIFFGCKDLPNYNEGCSMNKLKKYFSNNFDAESIGNTEGYTVKVFLNFEIDQNGLFKIIKVGIKQTLSDNGTIINAAKKEIERLAADLNNLTEQDEGLSPALDISGKPTTSPLQIMPLSIFSEELTEEEITNKIFAFESKCKYKALFAWKSDETHYINVYKSTNSEKIKVLEIDVKTKQEKLIKEYETLSLLNSDYLDKAQPHNSSEFIVAFGFSDDRLIEIVKKSNGNFYIYDQVSKSSILNSYDNLIAIYNSEFKKIILKN